MSDVRDQLLATVAQAVLFSTPQFRERVVDAILERFDVVPKPAVGSEELGAIAVSAVNWSSLDFSCLAAKQRSYQRAGDCLLDALGIAGLKIVRVDE